MVFAFVLKREIQRKIEICSLDLTTFYMTTSVAHHSLSVKIKLTELTECTEEIFFFSVPIFAAERNQRWMLKAVLRFFYGNKENSLWKFDLSVFPRLGTVNCTHIHILTFKRLEWHLSSNCKRIGTKLNKIATIWYIAA